MKNFLRAACCLTFTALLFNSCQKEPTYIAPPKPSVSQLYVASTESEEVTVIDAEDGHKIAGISVAETGHSMLMVHNVQVAPDGKTVWATCPSMDAGDTDQLVVIDPNTNRIIHRINLGVNLHPAHVVLNDDCTRAYITLTTASKVMVVDAVNFIVLKTFDFDSRCQPHGVRYSNGDIFIADMGLTRSMYIVNVNNGAQTVVPVNGQLIQSAVTPDGKYALVTSYDTKEIIRYDRATGDILKIPTTADAQGCMQLYPTPDSKYVFAADQGNYAGRPVSNKVFMIDVAQGKLVETITAGAAAHGVVVSRDGKTAYVTNSVDNTVTFIDVATRKVTRTVPVGKAPNGISFRDKTGGMP